jgi:hypothetical protein
VLDGEERRVIQLPVKAYVGLSLDAATERASVEGRFVRQLLSLTGPRRLDLAPRRVNVVLDETGKIVASDVG